MKTLILIQLNLLIYKHSEVYLLKACVKTISHKFLSRGANYLISIFSYVSSAFSKKKRITASTHVTRLSSLSPSFPFLSSTHTLHVEKEDFRGILLIKHVALKICGIHKRVNFRINIKNYFDEKFFLIIFCKLNFFLYLFVLTFQVFLTSQIKRLCVKM
jgi:hypothetical protein